MTRRDVMHKGLRSADVGRYNFRGIDSPTPAVYVVSAFCFFAGSNTGQPRIVNLATLRASAEQAAAHQPGHACPNL